jgi:hypothetical protein
MNAHPTGPSGTSLGRDSGIKREVDPKQSLLPLAWVRAVQQSENDVPVTCEARRALWIFERSRFTVVAVCVCVVVQVRT